MPRLQVPGYTFGGVESGASCPCTYLAAIALAGAPALHHRRNSLKRELRAMAGTWSACDDGFRGATISRSKGANGCRPDRFQEERRTGEQRVAADSASRRHLARLSGASCSLTLAPALQLNAVFDGR